MRRTVVLVVLSICAKTLGDVVHFLPPPVLLEPPVAFSGFNYLDTNPQSGGWPISSPPLLPETTTRFSLPEIIINKSAREGYPSGGEVANHHHDDSIVVNNQYLPPTPPFSSATTTVSTTTSSTTQRPLQDEPNYYLPPSASSYPDRNPNNGRNLYYYYPKPPIQFDEPFVEPAYLPPASPPFVAAPPSPPLNSYLPPPQQAATVLTRATVNRTTSLADNDFFGFGAAVRSLRLELAEMKCLSNGDDGYFRTRITVQSFIDTRPVFEDVIAANCDHRLEIQRNQIVIDIPAREFASCGIVNCGNGQRNDELCGRIRFPQIRGMRTVNDAILAFQCKPQERVISRTHAFRMGVLNDSHGRSAAALAQGGGDAKFRTQVGIFRRSGDAFARPLETNGVVQLGEDLMLRTQTRQGDGWNFTKITDISMQRLGSAGETLNTISLVGNSGCINPTMKSICPLPPQYEPPLGQRFGFRAVMFQGMKSGDEVVMSIRVMGCINRNDCEASHCLGGGRIRREVRARNESDEHYEVTRISFRVADPQEIPRHEKEEATRTLIITWSCIGIGLGFLGLVIFALVIVFHLRNKMKEEL